MTSPSAPVPVITGVVTLVRSSPTAPVSLAGVQGQRRRCAGAVVSMVTTNGADGTEMLPAASVSVAVRLCGPLVSALVVTDQLPPLTGAAHAVVPS